MSNAYQINPRARSWTGLIKFYSLLFKELNISITITGKYYGKKLAQGKFRFSYL